MLWEGGRSGRTATQLQSHLWWRFKSYRTQCHVNQYRVNDAFKKTFAPSSSWSKDSKSWILKMEAENCSTIVLWKPQNYVLYSWNVVMCHSQEAGSKEWGQEQLKTQLWSYMLLKIHVSWKMTLCQWVGYLCYGGACCLDLQGLSSQKWLPGPQNRGSKCFINSAVRTSKLSFIAY